MPGLDPLSIVMFALIGVLIFFMFRNNKKRQAAMQQLQNGLRPGAEVMLQSGIFGTVESIEEEDNKVTIHSGTSSFVVHRNAITQIVSAVDAPEETEAGSDLAPDDDPAFGARIAQERAENASESGSGSESVDADSSGESPSDTSDGAVDEASQGNDTDQTNEQTPKA